MDFFYFDADQRRGPVNAAQLRALAANGIITPDTTVEAGGRTLPARRIKGLEFASPVYPVEEPAPDPEPAPAPEPVIAKPREPDPPQPSPAAKKARKSLETWVSNLTTIAWLEIIAGVVGGAICFTQGDRDDSFIIAGIGAIIGGIGAAILPMSIASIGRFLLTHHD